MSLFHAIKAERALRLKRESILFLPTIISRQRMPKICKFAVKLISRKNISLFKKALKMSEILVFILVEVNQDILSP